MSKAVILGFLIGTLISMVTGVPAYAGILVLIGYVICWIRKEGW